MTAIAFEIEFFSTALVLLWQSVTKTLQEFYITFEKEDYLFIEWKMEMFLAKTQCQTAMGVVFAIFRIHKKCLQISG